MMCSFIFKKYLINIYIDTKSEEKIQRYQVNWGECISHDKNCSKASGALRQAQDPTPV